MTSRLRPTSRIRSLDAYRAVLAAEAYKAPAATTAVPDTLLESTPQFNATTAAGTAESFTEQLTNLGSTPETVAVSSRTLGAYSPVTSATVTLSDTSSPKSVDYQGFTDNYQAVTFNVGTGVDRLNGSIAFQATSSALAGRVRMDLISPTVSWLTIRFRRASATTATPSGRPGAGHVDGVHLEP